METLKDKYINMKNILESKSIKKELIDIEEQYGIEYVYDYIIKVINFLISTRNYNELIKYMDFYKELFPKRYLRTKGLNPKEIENTLYENYIINGFLYHITNKSNIEDILNNGLLTLKDKYGEEIFYDHEKINKIFNDIYERNRKISLKSIVNIPGSNSIEKERFNKVYLSSNLKYIISTYGNPEIHYLFIRDLLWALNLFEIDIDKQEKEEIIKIIINKLNEYDIKEEEKNFILNFLNKYIKFDKVSKDDKSIIMVPTNCINSTSTYFRLYKSRKIETINTEDLLELNYGEISNDGSIKSNNIMALTLNKDRSLSLKIGNS